MHYIGEIYMSNAAVTGKNFSIQFLSGRSFMSIIVYVNLNVLKLFLFFTLKTASSFLWLWFGFVISFFDWVIIENWPVHHYYCYCEIVLFFAVECSGSWIISRRDLTIITLNKRSRPSNQPNHLTITAHHHCPPRVLIPGLWTGG